MCSNNHNQDNINGKMNPRDLITFLWIITIPTIVSVLLFFYIYNDLNTSGLIHQFSNKYSKPYSEIAYIEAKYCDQKINVNAIMQRLEQEYILNQDRVLVDLSIALLKDKELNFIALIGPSGVGKSLVARALAKHWQWPDNVHEYAWNTKTTGEEAKFHMLRILFAKFSDCGWNLLIIDNLTPRDIGLVHVVNDMIFEQKQQEKLNKIKVVMIYIFNLDSMEDKTTYAQHYNMLQILPFTEVINFEPFGLDQLKDCIEREVVLEKMRISKEHFNDIMNTIKPSISGCKGVRTKVLTYGMPIKSGKEL